MNPGTNLAPQNGNRSGCVLAAFVLRLEAAWHYLSRAPLGCLMFLVNVLFPLPRSYLSCVGLLIRCS